MSVYLIFLGTFLGGVLIQIVLTSILPGPHFCPHIPLLMTLASGLFQGSVMGESLGFSWGLALDAMGTTAFGTQGFILCLIGYLSGRISRRVNAEEPVSQMVFGFLGTAVYFVCFHYLTRMFGGIGQSLSFGLVLSVMVMNVLLAPFVFSFMNWWRNKMDNYSHS